MATSQRRRIRQSILIWVDANVQSDSVDTKNTLDRLRELVDEVELIDTPTKCIEMLNELDQSKCYLITSGAFGKDLVEEVHSLRHLEAIFVFCGNKSYHEPWAKKWDKIRGVHTKIDPICDELRPILRQVRNDDVAMSIIQTGDENKDDAKQLPPSFMYSSMLKEVFFDMSFEEKHKNKMITMLLEKYSDNKKELSLINEFAKQYRPEKAIWWYTRQCFTFIEVNLGLRQLDASLIVDMAPYIVDLHKQIEQLYDQQQASLGRRSLTVYRGQGMIEDEFKTLTKSKNGLLSFNCFLSTSKKQDISLGFARGGTERPGHVGVLFVIKIDASLRVIPYAEIHEHSDYKNEAEVLFAMHSIFKIGEIGKCPHDSDIYQVELHLTDENDPKLVELKTYMAGSYGTVAGHRLGRTLLDMQANDKAEEIYLDLLETTTNEGAKGTYNHCLGLIKNHQGEYERALEYYHKSLEIDRKRLPENDPSLARTYNCIGQVYKNMGEYSKALEYYEKDLEISKKTLPENHPEIATSYCNIGSVYKNMGEYSKALTNYEKSLEIYKKTLPKNHPHIAISYCNIGQVYNKMGEYPKALEYYEKSLEIKKKTLPENHPSIATSYCNIGLVYNNMGEYSKALEYYEKDLEISKKTLPKNHPEIAASYHNMGCLFYRMKKYEQALEYLEEAKRIYTISLPPKHPEMKKTLDWIETVKKNMK